MCAVDILRAAILPEDSICHIHSSSPDSHSLMFLDCNIRSGIRCLMIVVAGSALVKVGQTQQKLGQAERDFIASSANGFIQPLRAFLDGDMKTVQVRDADAASDKQCLFKDLQRFMG